MTNEEFMQWQVDSYNDTVGNLNEQDGVECEICKNKGWVQYIANGYVTSKRCECMQKRIVLMRAKKSGLGEYLNKKVTDYLPWNDVSIKNKNILIEYLQHHSDDNVWFTAIGQSGSGKTLLCSIIANYLLFNMGRIVMYVTWTDFISRLKRDVMGDNTNEVTKYLDELKRVDVLFIDELIKKYNETDLKYLIEIINYRYTNNLKTIITSERQLNELLNIDEATFGRVVEKCQSYVISMPNDRKLNYRLRGLVLD